MGWREIKERNDREKAEGVVHVHPEHVGRAVVHVNKITPPRPSGDPCGYALPLTGAERERLNLSHAKAWNRCRNKRLPLGREIVCPCDGCGAGCSGYDPDAEPVAEPAPVVGWEDVPGWFAAEEGAAYSELLRAKRPGDVAEVGSHRGRSAVLAADVLAGTGAVLHCIDRWEDAEALADFRRHTGRFGDRVVPHRASSLTAARAFAADGRRFAAVFIDADHTYESTAADIDAWARLVVPGGVVCGHDCNPNWPGVVRAVDERFPVREHVGSFWWARVPDRFGPVGKRHLVYHILPVSGNGVWHRGVDALRLRWGLFTGRKIVSVATGGPVMEQVDGNEGPGRGAKLRPLDSPAVVRAYLPPGCEVVEVPNHPGRWEHASWAGAWARVLDGADERDAVLYAHAKGVTRRAGSPCHTWAEILYALALDHWPRTEAILRNAPVCGSLVKPGDFFGGAAAGGAFHYSGNFWWARAGTLRDRLAAVPCPADRWGAEAWPGLAWPLADAGNLYTPAAGTGHLYAPAQLESMVADYSAWLVRNRPAEFLASARVPAGVRLSVILPTVGRPSLVRAVASVSGQLLPGDEIIILSDRSGDWGATPRTAAQKQATGDYLAYLDDDDVFTPDALASIRRAVGENPGRPHLFRMKRGAPFADVLPRVREVRVGDVSTQMFVTPNDPARLGRWGTRYEGDFDFITSTLALYPPGALVWRDEVIAEWRT